MTDDEPLDAPAAILRQLADLAARMDRLAAVVEAGQRDQSRMLRRAHEAAAIYLGDHTALTFLENGRLMLVDTRDRAIGIHILHGGRWETHYTAAFARMLAPGAVVVDVGANLGWYSLVAAPLVGPSGRVFAVEPNPGLAKLLVESLHINGFAPWATVVQAAVSDAPGAVDLVSDPRVPGGGQIRPAALSPGPFAEAATRVIAAPLDALLAAHAGPVDVLKMDVEGWEGVALRGMGAILDRSPAMRIMLEWSPGQDATPAPRAESAAALSARGYTPFRVAHDGSLARAGWPAALAMTVLDNLVLLPEGDPLAVP